MAEHINPIARRRQDAGLTRAELAAVLGLSAAAIGGLERGESGPSPETLQRLGEAFKVPGTALTIELETYRQYVAQRAGAKLEAVG